MKIPGKFNIDPRHSAFSRAINERPTEEYDRLDNSSTAGYYSLRFKC